MNSYISNRLFFGGIAILLLIRLFHFGHSIDEPHDWRQCDTAYYIQDFYKNGIDLLHPAVCWMGDSDTLALEFPLPEALVAIGYKILGDSIPLARLFFLIFFCGAVYYYHRIVDLLFGNDFARLASLVYLVLPLSLYYSRAIHIDFFVIFCTHAMVYFYLLAIQNKRWIYFLMSSLAATLAFTVKVPYAFFWALPMLWFAWHRNVLSWTLKYAAFYLIAIISFFLWQRHVQAINGLSPDWNYILHYHKMTQSPGWYFGTIGQRLSLYPWWVLLKRGILEVTGIVGLIFFILGTRKIKRLENLPFLVWWMIGSILYVLVFFNLNFVHNYYQIPLLAPAAVMIAGGIYLIGNLGQRWMMSAYGLLCIGNIWFTEKTYYEVPQDLEEIGRLIQNNTPDSALVIVTYGQMDCRNPKILYRARRRGWSIEEAALKPEVIQKLNLNENASYWAYIGIHEPSGHYEFLQSRQVFRLLQ
ncbi:MAG: glycosyltransferase family 39 protein [Saprospiraceae bacterium]|nr:glycosyltransferase family 39 protein [Saprospiraceae bacterium]